MRKLCVSLASSSAWPSPVRTWVAGRQDRTSIDGEQLRLRRSLRRSRADLVELPFLLEEPLRRAAGRRRRASPRRCCLRPRSRTAPTRAAAVRRPSACTPICSPTSMSFLRGSGRVHGDIAGGRPVALLEHDRVEAGLGGVDREADVRRAAELDHVAVVVDQLRFTADTAHRGVDFGQRPHLGEQRLVERRDLDSRLLADVEGGLAGDDGVGALVDRREDRVEGLRDRVGQDIRARDRRHAEHDREAREERSELPGPEGAKGDSSSFDV